MVGLAVTLILCSVQSAAAEEPAGSDSHSAINERMHQQLDGGASKGKIETVSGQMYIPQANVDAEVIGEAIGALLAGQQAEGHAVSVRSPARLNFEINFEKDSADLTDQSRLTLDQLAEVLDTDFPESRFILGGHTDQDGDDAVNQPLSQARADSARAYLVKAHKIAPDRLEAKGYGESEPLRQIEESPQDKRYNRRVDLRPLR